MVIKQAFQYKTKGIYLKMRPKERNLFVSMWNKYAEFRFTIVATTFTFNKRNAYEPYSKWRHKIKMAAVVGDSIDFVVQDEWRL